MKIPISLLALLPLAGYHPARAEVKLDPLHAGFALEYGLMNGLTFFEPTPNAERFTINRTIGWISQSATVDERFDLNLALGGLFFQFFPFNKGFDYAKVRNSAVSIGQASARYRFGDADTYTSALSFGLFPYKYNPDSRNLGEYLFRSTPYPTTTINGSWDLINSSYAKLKGIRFETSLWEGRWKNDFLATLSDETFPLNDLSLAYLTSLKLGALTLGAGVNFANLLPSSPSLSTPENRYNSYFTYAGTTYYADDTYYQSAAKYFEEQAGKSATPADSLLASARKADFERIAKLVDSLNKAETDGTLAQPLGRKYYTYRGTLMMARASLDLASLFGMSQEFKLYGEADVLGWTNYPIFYENRGDRMPLMAGISVPTWGMLDNLSMEVEYWKNRYPIIYVKALVDGRPIVDYNAMSPRIDITSPYAKDDWKWSVHATRSIGKSFALIGQVANDHTRPIRYDFSPYKYETMLDSRAWYFLLRAQMSM